jgi:E3 ubiquitin-protein ligase MARCH6
MHYFRPRKAVRRIAETTWKYFAHHLRLTSYFFGKRDPDEESSLIGWNYFANQQPRVKDGGFRRVPATDHIALPREMRATVAVDDRGEPIDEAARDLMIKQNKEAEKAKRDVAKDYTTVYIPPRFAFRVIIFLTCMWVLGTVVVGLVISVPILLGRRFFKLFLPNDVHDGYSFIIGFYMLWACFIVGKAVDRLDKRRQRRGSDGPRADLRVLVLKRGLLWVAKISYMVTTLGIIIPALLSIVVDLYVIYPIRFVTEPGLVPRIRMIDSWALGLLYAKIALYVQEMQHGRQRPQQQQAPQLQPIFYGIQRVSKFVVRCFV